MDMTSITGFLTSAMPLLKPLGLVTLQDTLIFLKWAWENDQKISKWEIMVYLPRLLLYGGASFLMILFGVPQELALVMAGVGPVMEYLAQQRAKHDATATV